MKGGQNFGKYFDLMILALTVPGLCWLLFPKSGSRLIIESCSMQLTNLIFQFLFSCIFRLENRIPAGITQKDETTTSVNWHPFIAAA